MTLAFPPPSRRRRSSGTLRNPLAGRSWSKRPDGQIEVDLGNGRGLITSPERAVREFGCRIPGYEHLKPEQPKPTGAGHGHHPGMSAPKGGGSRYDG